MTTPTRPSPGSPDRRWALLLLVTAAVLLVLAFRPPVSAVRVQQGAAAIEFQLEPAFVPALDTCATVTWRVEGISEVYLDDAPVIGSGQVENCAPITQPNRLRVIFADGAEQIFGVQARLEPMRSTETWLWLALSAACMAGGLAWWLAPHQRRAWRTRARTAARCAAHWLTPERLTLIILALGVLLRVQEYLGNRPLWGDEAGLSLNILNRDYAGLLQPLDYGQAAPVGYLWALRLSVDVLGVNEYALRLASLAASIAGLSLIWPVARRLLDRWAMPLAMLIFAVADMQVYYASEIKQYALDACLTLAFLLLALHMLKHPASGRRVLLWSAAGVAILVFSLPAIFTAAALGVVLVLQAARDRPARALWKIIAPAVWLGAFALMYWLFYGTLNQSDFLNEFWARAFAPHEVGAAIGWVWERLTAALPGAASLVALGSLTIVGFIVGVGVLERRGRGHGLLLALPIAFAGMAALLRLYPFEGRLLLFTAPLLTLGAAQGVYTLLTRAPGVPTLARRLAWAVVLIPLLLMLPPESHATPDIRPAILHIRERASENDTVVVFGGVSATYYYYAAQFGLEPARLVDGRTRELLNGQFAFDSGETVWLFRRGEEDPEGWQQTLDYFDAIGRRVDALSTPGGTTIAYEIE